MNPAPPSTKFLILPRLLIVGATAVMRLARKDNACQSWATKLLERKPTKLAAVALANRTARIAWAVMTRGRTYEAPVVAQLLFTRQNERLLGR